MYVDWGPPDLSLVVYYISHLLIPLPCKAWFYKNCNKNCKNHVLDVIRTLATSNQAIYYNLQNICFSPFVDLDTLKIMSPKIDALYLWIMFGPLKFSLLATIDHQGPSIHSGHYTASIKCCKKHSIATITQLRSLKLLIEFWTRIGGWEFDRSHGAGTSSPSYWPQAQKPVGWMMCFLLMTFVPVQKLC